MAKKNVDIQFIQLESDVASTPVDFDEVLIALNGLKRQSSKKTFEIKIWEQGENDGLITGLIITEQMKDLPPKRNSVTGTFSSLGLLPNETLAYGNVFLYDKSLHVLFYEVNGNGCYLDTLFDLLQEEWNIRQNGQQRQIIEINAVSIPRNGGLQHFNNMIYLKEFDFEITCPNVILQEYNDRKSSLLSAINSDLKRAARNNADILKLSFATFGKNSNGQGLDVPNIKKLIKAGMFILRGPKREHVQKFKVVGYEIDPNGKNKRNIADFITDILRDKIELPIVQQQSDLQEQTRKSEIYASYNRVHATLINLL